VLFGIGGGWNPEESKILGGDFEHRWTQIKDAIAGDEGALDGGDLRVYGRYVDFSAAPLLFEAGKRKPHPPIRLGSIQKPRALIERRGGAIVVRRDGRDGVYDESAGSIESDRSLPGVRGSAPSPRNGRSR